MIRLASCSARDHGICMLVLVKLVFKDLTNALLMPQKLLVSFTVVNKKYLHITAYSSIYILIDHITLQLLNFIFMLVRRHFISLFH